MGALGLDQEQREYVATMQASSRTLIALVDDVLDISVIEAGKVRLHHEDFSPRELVAGVGLVMQGQARARNLGYLVVVADDVPEMVRGDAGRLRLEGKEYRVQEGDVLHFRFNV